MATYQRPDPGLQRMLLLAFEHELPKVLEEWKAEVEAGRVTGPMKRFFADLGWLSSDRDSRLGEPVTEPGGEPAAAQEEAFREPSTTPRRGRQAKAQDEGGPPPPPPDE